MENLTSDLDEHLQEMKDFILNHMNDGELELLKTTAILNSVFRKISTRSNAACITCVEVLFSKEIQSLIAKQLDVLSDSNSKKKILREMTDFIVSSIKIANSQEDQRVEKECPISKPLLESLTKVWSTSTSLNTLYNLAWIFSQVWRSLNGRGYLKNVFAKHHEPKTPLEARKFIPLIVLQANKEASLADGVLQCVPNLARQILSSTATMINAWRIFGKSELVAEMAWCTVQCNAFLEILKRSIIPPFHHVKCDTSPVVLCELGRLLRCLTRAMIEVPSVSESFHKTLAKFILALMDPRFQNATMDDFYFAMMSESEFKERLNEAFHVAKKSNGNLLFSLRSALRARRSFYDMRPLCREDFELMAPPEFVSRKLQEIPDHKLFSEPEMGCHSMLEKFGDRLLDNVITQECVMALDWQHKQMFGVDALRV